MVTMYEIIDFLCARNEITIAKMCRDLGMRQGLISDLKHGRSKTLSTVNMQKIANYFQVSTDIFNEGTFEETLPNGADLQMLHEIALKNAIINKKAPGSDNSNQGVTDDDIKFALFGGDGEITDAMYEEVKRFAQMVKMREDAKKKG